MSAARALHAVERACVGSLNEPKQEAVRAALEPFASVGLRVEGVGVSSGVPEQPVGFAEDGRREALGTSSGFAYPPVCAATALRDRAPIGDLFDRYWAQNAGDPEAGDPDGLPSSRVSGNVGKLTLGVLPRSDYARHAVLCALVQFLHPSLYSSSSSAPSSSHPTPSKGPRA